jgi:hypothetical protein
LAKVYLCPHCRARNRFHADEAADGIVLCGACSGRFMLPDFVPEETEVGQETAIIDARGIRRSELAEPSEASERGRGFEPLDTEIVVADTHKSRPAPLAVVEVPDGTAPPSRLAASRAPTHILTDAAAEAVRLAREIQSSQTTVEPPYQEIRRDKTTTISDRGVAADAGPGDGPGKTMAPESDRRAGLPKDDAAADWPLSVENNPSDTARTGPSDVFFDDPTDAVPAHSARTLPTPPPQEFLTLQDPIPAANQATQWRSDPLAGTQPAHHVDESRGGVTVLVMTAIAVVIVAGAFMIGANTRSSARDQAVEWSAGRLTAQVEEAASVLDRTMAAGEPHLAARIFRPSHASDLVVARADGKRAFEPGDLSTYRSVLSRACSSRTGAAKIWLASGDPKLRAGRPCETILVDDKPASAAGIPTDLQERASASETITWINGDVQFAATPIDNTAECGVCHSTEKPSARLGWVVASADVTPLKDLGGSWLLILLIGLGTAIVAIVLVMLWPRPRMRSA